MQTYFNVRYEFDQELVHDCIARQLQTGTTDYICVADGVILNIANRKPDYLAVVNGGMFSICDSSYVPLYIRLLYGKKFRQYCGSQIFMDIVGQKKYRMFFMGTSQRILQALRKNLMKIDERIGNMTFYDLPYKEANDFDYKSIAEIIKQDGAEIIWVALGAPKQEIFMSKLKPYLRKGVMIAVGATFKFYSGLEEKRAPQWIVKLHMEFLFRIVYDPKKQLKRCGWIVVTLPGLLYGQWRRKSIRPEQMPDTEYRDVILYEDDTSAETQKLLAEYFQQHGSQKVELSFRDRKEDTDCKRKQAVTYAELQKALFFCKRKKCLLLFPSVRGMINDIRFLDLLEESHVDFRCIDFPWFCKENLNMIKALVLYKELQL